MSTKPKILVVDDDRDLVVTLRLLLERAGYAVVDASGPGEGLEKVERERPELILLDVMMPDATEGFHFVWKLRHREEPYFHDVPIVMLTAIHGKTDLRFYPDSGDGTYAPGEYLPVQEFLDKPIDPRELLDRVAKVLAISHLSAPVS
jgi:CheY-like chemotaxis protein